MTQAEKIYAKLIGQLFWSVQRQSLVFISGLNKYYGRWRYDIFYSNTESLVKQQSKTRDAREILRLIQQGRWITAADFMKFYEEYQAKNKT